MLKVPKMSACVFRYMANLHQCNWHDSDKKRVGQRMPASTLG